VIRLRRPHAAGTFLFSGQDVEKKIGVRGREGQGGRECCSASNAWTSPRTTWTCRAARCWRCAGEYSTLVVIPDRYFINRVATSIGGGRWEIGPFRRHDAWLEKSRTSPRQSRRRRP
jgi:hypothetical protein